MKQIILSVLLLLMIKFSNAQFDHSNIELLGTFNDTSVVPENQYHIRYQACWGWVDSVTGNEYGIIGSTAGTYIINVTDPTNPVQSDYIPHRQNDCIWHEYKTYGNYLYIISDDPGPNSFQIADLSYLPDSVHVIYDSTDIFTRSHTLFIDGNKLYCGGVNSIGGFSPMNIYSLNDPTHPTLLRSLNQDYSFINYVHDMFVVNDTIYASCGYQGLYIFKYDSIANQFQLLGSLQDAVNIYNHSSFLSPDHGTLYMCEEVPDGQPIKIVDVHDISNPTLTDVFYSNPGATPHNPSVWRNFLIMAYYQDGVYMYDISDPGFPSLAGYFDTYPTNPPGIYLQPAYAGCWSTYSDLPSGTLLASDMQLGLFCLDVSLIDGINKLNEKTFSVYPNPATDYLRINNAQNSTLCLFDITGKLQSMEEIKSGNMTINLSGLNKGMYIAKFTFEKNTFTQKIIIH
jgi:choice-of-anchor B domain-containing protein